MEKFKNNLSQEKFKINKFRRYTKIAALSALLSIPSISSAFTQENLEKADTIEGIEQTAEQPSQVMNKVIESIEEKGRSGKMGSVEVKHWGSKDEQTDLTAGYSEDGQKVEWIILEDNNGTIRFFDSDADGDLDRIIINHEEADLGKNQKAGENDLKTFSPMEQLAEQADVVSSLNPENVKVYQILEGSDEASIQSIDFQTGEVSELVGTDAESIISKAQNSFTDSLINLEI